MRVSLHPPSVPEQLLHEAALGRALLRYLQIDFLPMDAYQTGCAFGRCLYPVPAREVEFWYSIIPFLID